MPSIKSTVYRLISLAFLFMAMPQIGAQELQLAPGYGSLGYEVPAVGSYKLPPLGVAGDGQILTSSNQLKSLHKLFDGKYVLLSFIYSRCDDVNGCPLSTHVFYQIKSAMSKDPELAENLKLVSLSFDPEYDTAEVLQLYANNFVYAGNRGDWQFVSTESVASLKPILEEYGQDIQREVSLNGDSGRFSHILRVFLIDPELKIRNIYSVAFLHQDLLLTDVKTLIKEGKESNLLKANVEPEFSISIAGDDKTGYESGNYATHARAVELRHGKKTDLFANAKNVPLGLPAIPEPENNALTPEKIELGRRLFFDRRLSLNQTFSCAMCHVPEQGFTSNEMTTAVGIEGRSVRRNSPTIYNLGYSEVLFHDGREFTLEQQIWGPLLAKNEMGNPSIGHVIEKIRSLKEYDNLFEQAFDGKAVSMETLGMAFASYQRALVSANSPFDRWYYGNEANAMSESAQRGYQLFTGAAGCSSCHQVSETHALFSDQKLHNTGMGYNESMGIRPEKTSVQLAPGIFAEVETKMFDTVGHAPASDVGQYEVTENPADRWKYKTPGLRNVALTAPYMHNGSLSSLADVVAFYNRGGVPNLLLDNRIKPLNLNQQQQQDLVSFLESLTGSNVSELVSDAFAAPVGDVLKKVN